MLSVQMWHYCNTEKCNIIIVTPNIGHWSESLIRIIDQSHWSVPDGGCCLCRSDWTFGSSLLSCSLRWLICDFHSTLYMTVAVLVTMSTYLSLHLVIPEPRRLATNQICGFPGHPKLTAWRSDITGQCQQGRGRTSLYGQTNQSSSSQGVYGQAAMSSQRLLLLYFLFQFPFCHFINRPFALLKSPPLPPHFFFAPLFFVLLDYSFSSLPAPPLVTVSQTLHV